MKIPDKICISGVEYAVELGPNLRDASRLLCGRIDYDACKIHLSTTDCQNHQYKCIVLWHEILHGIIEDRGLELDDDLEEKVCEALSRGIYQVLQDNGGRLFDLATPGPRSGEMFERRLMGVWKGGGEDDDDDDKDHSER